MIEVLGCSIVIISATATGFILGEGFKKRTVQLNELIRSVHQLQNQITYTYTPLPDAIFNISQKSMYPFSTFFGEISKLLNLNQVNSIHEAFLKAFEKNKKNLFLSEKDIHILMDMAKTLGECDVQGEKRIFELTLSSLKAQYEEAIDEMHRNLKIYRTLGFTIGAMVVIILI